MNYFVCFHVFFLMTELYINGDSYARGVLQCIMDIVDLYGDEFIFQQCLPFIENSVSI